LTAFSFGKPVIVTKVGALPGVVNIVKGGYIIYPNNPDLLFKAMDKVSNIPRDELVKLSKNIQKNF
jgi:glycosyltransferase involved in cell wall biosynthesis